MCSPAQSRLRPLLRALASDLVRLPLEAGGRPTFRAIEDGLRGAPMGPLLDAGCGTGMLVRAGGRRPYTGLDGDAGSLRLARLRASFRDACFVQGDLREMPFADGSFATAFCHGVLHHLDDAGVGRALAELVRVTRGRIVLADPIRDDEPAYRKALYDLDAGRWIRSSEALIALVRPHLQIDRRWMFRSGVNRKLLLVCVGGLRGSLPRPL